MLQPIVHRQNPTKPNEEWPFFNDQTALPTDTAQYSKKTAFANNMHSMLQLEITARHMK